MADLQVSLTATRFVDAVVALRRARRHWHRLDAALVQMPQTPARLEAFEALRRLDHAIANATDGLLQSTPDR
jgi:hypothetical protein